MFVYYSGETSSK